MKPMQSALKINIDGSSLDNPSSTGMGGLVRDGNGRWVTGFPGYIGINTTMHVELTTIYYRLKIAIELGDVKIRFEFDSLESMNLVVNGNSSIHKYGVIIEDIRQILVNKPSVKIRHIL